MFWKAIIATHSYTAYGNEHSWIRHAWSTSYVSGSVGGSRATSSTFCWALSGPSCTHEQFPSLQGCVGSPFQPFGSPIPRFSVKFVAGSPPTPIRRYSQTCRDGSSPHLSRANFSCYYQCCRFLSIDQFWFDPLAMNLKISTRTGKRAGMEADREAADPAVLARSSIYFSWVNASQFFVQFHAVCGGEDLLTFSCHNSWKSGLRSVFSNVCDEARMSWFSIVSRVRVVLHLCFIICPTLEGTELKNNDPEWKPRQGLKRAMECTNSAQACVPHPLGQKSIHNKVLIFRAPQIPGEMGNTDTKR